MSGFDEDHNFDNGTKAKKLRPVNDMVDSGMLSFAKVFLYMFIYLLITAGVAFGVGYAISYSYALTGSETIPTLYLALIIVAAVGLFAMTIITNLVVIKGRHSVLVPSIIYAVLVGFLFSTLTIFVDWLIMGLAFAITAGVFLIMSLIAVFTKGNLAPLGMMAMGMFLGAGLLVLINLFLGSDTLRWAVSFIIFAALMFITMYDIWAIKKMTENGPLDKNLSYYCAFRMYVDFINIFIRILYYLIIIFARKR